MQGDTDKSRMDMYRDSNSSGGFVQIISALFVGLIFGLGLILGGMTEPAKVIGFLDLGGQWDPSLAFVMGGAMAVAAFAFRLAGTRTQSLLGAPMQIPKVTRVDLPLIAGSLFFGIGWGLAGFCPGPAIVAFGSGRAEPALFVLAMLVGMAMHEYRPWRR